MKTWVVGRGGLLGRSVEQRLASFTEVFVPNQKFDWSDSSRVTTQLATECQSFFSTVGDDNWTIYWCAGRGTLSSAPDQMHVENEVFKSLLQALESSLSAAAKRVAEKFCDQERCSSFSWSHFKCLWCTSRFGQKPRIDFDDLFFDFASPTVEFVRTARDLAQLYICRRCGQVHCHSHAKNCDDQYKFKFCSQVGGSAREFDDWQHFEYCKVGLSYATVGYSFDQQTRLESATKSCFQISCRHRARQQVDNRLQCRHEESNDRFADFVFG